MPESFDLLSRKKTGTNIVLNIAPIPGFVI